MSIQELGFSVTKLSVQVTLSDDSQKTLTIYVNGPESTWATQIMLKLRAQVLRYKDYKVLSTEAVRSQWTMPQAAKLNLKTVQMYASTLRPVDSKEDVPNLILALTDLKKSIDTTIKSLQA